MGLWHPRLRVLSLGLQGLIMKESQPESNRSPTMASQPKRTPDFCGSILGVARLHPHFKSEISLNWLMAKSTKSLGFDHFISHGSCERIVVTCAQVFQLLLADHLTSCDQFEPQRKPTSCLKSLGFSHISIPTIWMAMIITHYQHIFGDCGSTSAPVLVPCTCALSSVRLRPCKMGERSSHTASVGYRLESQHGMGAAEWVG